ncbi:MAG: hypothetical protein EBZ48_00120 [Proteobacteria bacterium]|nr:hypothetical protein [Pseudomonadota bacterium]
MCFENPQQCALAGIGILLKSEGSVHPQLLGAVALSRVEAQHRALSELKLIAVSGVPELLLDL